MREQDDVEWKKRSEAQWHALLDQANQLDVDVEVWRRRHDALWTLLEDVDVSVALIVDVVKGGLSELPSEGSVPIAMFRHVCEQFIECMNDLVHLSEGRLQTMTNRKLVNTTTSFFPYPEDDNLHRTDG